MNPLIAHPRSLLRHGARYVLVALGGATLCLAANLANAAPSNNKDIDAAYQRERASCMDGASNEDRATCLKEAGAARDAARRGQLTDDSAAEQQNAVARCRVLPESDRNDCMQRMQGGGRVSGSVREGGLFRETITTVPAAPAPGAMPAGSAP